MTSPFTSLLHWEELPFELELIGQPHLHVALAREDVSFELELTGLRRQYLTYHSLIKMQKIVGNKVISCDED